MPDFLRAAFIKPLSLVQHQAATLRSRGASRRFALACRDGAAGVPTAGAAKRVAAERGGGAARTAPLQATAATAPARCRRWRLSRSATSRTATRQAWPLSGRRLDGVAKDASLVCVYLWRRAGRCCAQRLALCALHAVLQRSGAACATLLLPTRREDDAALKGNAAAAHTGGCLTWDAAASRCNSARRLAHCLFVAQHASFRRPPARFAFRLPHAYLCGAAWHLRAAGGSAPCALVILSARQSTGGWRRGGRQTTALFMFCMADSARSKTPGCVLDAGGRGRHGATA